MTRHKGHTGGSLGGRVQKPPSWFVAPQVRAHREAVANQARRASKAEALLERRLADGTAVPGRHIGGTSRGPCHWCGFRIGPKGHPNCPEQP